MSSSAGRQSAPRGCDGAPASVTVRIAAQACALLLLLGFAGDLAAVHLPDHRFTVAGVVVDAAGRGVAGETVSLLGGRGEVLASVVTDVGGRFSVLLHVHDEDHGKVFDVQVRDLRRRVSLDFVPGDTQAERGATLEFIVHER